MKRSFSVTNLVSDDVRSYQGLSPREALVSAAIDEARQVGSIADRAKRDVMRAKIQCGKHAGTLWLGDLAVASLPAVRFELGVMTQSVMSLKALYRKLPTLGRLVLDIVEPDREWSGAAKEGNFSVEQVLVTGPGKKVSREREGRELHRTISSMLALGIEGRPFLESDEVSREVFELLPCASQEALAPQRPDRASRDPEPALRNLADWGPAWRAKRILTDRKMVSGQNLEECAHDLFGGAWDERMRVLREVHRMPLGYFDPMLSDENYQAVVVCSANYSEEFPEGNHSSDGEVEPYSVYLRHEDGTEESWFDVQPDKVVAGATQEDVKLEALRIGHQLAETLEIALVDLEAERQHAQNPRPRG